MKGGCRSTLFYFDATNIISTLFFYDASRSEGKSVLLISAELEEVMALSDRIMVMYEGKIAGMVDADDADERRIGLMMMGGAADV
ncbi:MAG: hypothetical protein LBG50_01360 [Clostridiales Family XIII bacterium]|jgi:ABC-type uncharacterized transport system ATPase subunit|nr:hypothetical protein [Clostridiales Family XIII bacterium]